MSILKEQDITKPSFVIDPNPKYDFSYQPDDVYLLQNVPEDVNYQTTATSSSGTRALSFTINNPNLFLDRGITLNVGEIPFVIQKSGTAPTAKPDATNYVDVFFDGYKQIAMRQFGFLNCIDSIKVNLDGTVFTVNNVAEMLKICSRYYDESVVNDKIDASLPDLMKYANYKETPTAVDSVTEGGKPFQIKPSISNTYSPFGNLGTSEYNTRQPSFVFVESGAADWAGATEAQKNTVTVMTSGFQCFLPFSIFSIPGDQVPLVGVRTIELTLNLKVNWMNYLFSTQPGYLVNLGLKTDFTKIEASLNWRSYTPPEYISRGLGNGIPDYSLAFPTVEMHNTVKEVVFTAGSPSASIASADYDLRAIPKAIYIAVRQKMNGNLETTSVADVYARINSLNIELCGKKTQIFSDASGVFTIAKSNGLNMSKESMYISGFPLKLVTSNDLGCKTNSLVGSTANISNKLILTNLSVTNVCSPTETTTYELVVTPVYDGLLHYSHGKFTQYESLISRAHDLNVSVHTSELYNGQLQAMNNVIGGSIGTIFGSMVPYLKKVAKGAWNVGKHAFQNKEFRDMIGDIANGNKVGWNQPVTKGSGYSVTGGAYDSHSPTLGGGRQFKPY